MPNIVQLRDNNGMFLLKRMHPLSLIAAGSIRCNSYVVHYFERRKKNATNLGNGTASSTDLDDGCDATAVLLKKGNKKNRVFFLNTIIY